MLTLRKRGRFWHIRGSVRVGKETRIVKEFSVGCTRKGDAEQYRLKTENDIRQEIINGTSWRAGELTFADAGTLYLNRPDGLHKADMHRLTLIARHLGDERLSSVLDAWQKFVEGWCRGLKPSTIARYRATAQAAINYCGEVRHFDAPRLPTIKADTTRERHLTLEEQEALLDAYADHVKPIALTLCFQGCRSQEALRLRWRNVDFNLNTLYFPETKNGEPRTVPMHPRVRAALEALSAEREAGPNDHVFLNRFGRPYSAPNDYAIPGGNPLSKAHATACRRAKIDDFRVHDWRHHWASWCSMRGIGVFAIQKAGGWKSPAMVQKYAALSVEHLQEEMKKLA